MELAGWRPWRVLREREHLTLEYGLLSRGRGRIEERGGRRRLITLDLRLRQLERREVLAHELIHDEYDLLWPPGTPPLLTVKGEQFVDREVARRLVPQSRLRELRSEREVVTVADVVEEFDCTPEMAERAMLLLMLEEG